MSGELDLNVDKASKNSQCQVSQKSLNSEKFKNDKLGQATFGSHILINVIQMRISWPLLMSSSSGAVMRPPLLTEGDVSNFYNFFISNNTNFISIFIFLNLTT